MKRKLLSMVMLLWSTMMFAQFSGSGTGTESDPYLIYNENQLAQVANFLGQEGVVFKLQKDLNVSNYIAENNPNQGWTPIGVQSSPFQGMFYGNGHTISGVFINRSSTNYVGFFGYVSGAIIQDLNISGTSIKGSTDVGGIVGNANSSTISNCSVTLSSGVEGYDDVGGIVGKPTSSTISNCIVSFSGGIEGSEDNIGGVAGLSSSSAISNCTVSLISGIDGRSQVGGIAGSFSGSSITNCSFEGNVRGTYPSIGGIAGFINSTYIINSTITGNVTGNDTIVGGVAGSVGGTCIISNVNCVGDVSGSGIVSGIAGKLLSGASVSFRKAFSKGKITNTGDFTGGIVGKSDGPRIAGMTDCSHFGDITGQNYVGGLVGQIVGKQEARPVYYISTSSSTMTGGSSYNNTTIEKGTQVEVTINNCTAIGNINGKDFVGGIIGKDEPSYSYTLVSVNGGSVELVGDNWRRYNWRNNVFLGDFFNIHFKPLDRFNLTTSSITNSYYSGFITGTSHVGGLVGYKMDGNISNCYTHATISGVSNVGGLVGDVLGYVDNDGFNDYLTIKSNVAINTSISASSSNLGRIYGKKENDYVTIGALASSEGNRALTQTSVMLSGVAQVVNDDLQNGTSVGPSMLKLKANYVSWGWNFDDNWNILETECFPYKKYQAAPPVIESDLVSQATSISGSSLDGGTVYLYYKDHDAVSTTCNGNAWQFSTEALQSGAQVQLYADIEGMTPSYLTSAVVKYPGSGTEEDPYRIYTAEDLQGACNSGYYKLMNDIDLSAWINENSPTKGWPAIGRNSTVATYIDGDGHKVTGLWINTTEGYNGLFSNYSAGYIKNLTVEVATGKKVKGGDYTGVLIGRMYNGQIINCSVKGDVEGTDYASVLTGYIGNGKIENCVVNGNASGTKHVGGLSAFAENATLKDNRFEGKVTSQAASAYVGGLAGHAKNVTTTNCSTSETISSVGNNSFVGGFFGKSETGSITKCYAEVNITANGTNDYVGGLIGRASTPVSQCYTTGNVTASGDDSYTAGLVAYTTAAVDNCYSTANANGTLYTAGLVGYTFSTVDKCYAKGDITGDMYGAGVVGEMDGAAAATTNCVAVNNTITLSAQSSWGCRVIGGFKNGCSEPDLSNFALNTMQVSLNGVPQRKTDDNIEGIAKTNAELMHSALYEGISWNMTEIWSIDEGQIYPYLLWEVEVNPVTEITLDNTSLIIAVGNTSTISATVMPLGATNKRLAWTSANTAIASVENGEVTAVGVGETTITATSTDGSNISATCSVTVVANHDDAIAELQALVNQAQSYYNNSTEGEDIGQYASGSRAALLAVIQSVNAQISSTMSESEISACIQAITDAINEFKSKEVTAGEDTDITQYDNVIYIENIECAPGNQLTVSLKMNNQIAASGFQCDLYLPNGVTVATDEDGFYQIALSTARTTTTKTNMFDSVLQGDGSIRILCNSTKNYAFSGNEGEVATIVLNIDGNMEEGDYPVILKNIEIANKNNPSAPAIVNYVKSTLTVFSFILGDANGSRSVTVSDLTMTASYILGGNPDGFIFKAADVTMDNNISVSDLTGIANIILYGSVNGQNVKSMVAAQAPQVALRMPSVTIARGETAEVDVFVKNVNCNIAAYQFDLQLPEGVKVVNAEWNRSRLEGTPLFDGAEMNDAFRVLCASINGETFTGNDGAIATLTLEASETSQSGDAIIKNIELSENGKSYMAANTWSAIKVVDATAISAIDADKNPVDVFDMSGRMLKSRANNADLQLLPRGSYIIGGKKIVK